ncbi:NAD(P)-dependent oxidoreductase [Pseudohongiella sp. SYSU M77423]|uniref:NAD-dependent epimerase/dehydratase family protein n=1 Tax=Pseudohongiella sp. SYSU M77423 TaxID=3042312 RepID=UPI00248170C2|nr:NAD(P)-dependent oxidoreductase [Pseudohongiella sp. SYSU M77423]MDH7942940.1 NAD(P)-dependent oxidoreductase [Pseudohongiella sp. SYSU M77423]
MNVLVVGGSGFIGTRLVKELIEAGHYVKIYDLQQSISYPDNTIIGDIRSADSLVRAARGFDVIYNLAAEHRDDVTPSSLYHDVNVAGADNVIQAAVRNGINHIVFTSSVAIYGLNKNHPDEGSPIEPFNEYGRTKWAAEMLYQQWANEDTSRNLGIVRPAVVFGEGNRGNVYNLISQISTGRFLMVGNGENRKSMGYVGNIAYFLTILGNLKGIQVFNFCDKPDLTSSEIAEIIANGLGKKLPSVKLPLSLGLIAGSFFDLVSTISGKKLPISAIRIRKFAAETTISTARLKNSGYKPKFELTEGIIRMIEHEFGHQNKPSVAD